MPPEVASSIVEKIVTDPGKYSYPRFKKDAPFQLDPRRITAIFNVSRNTARDIALRAQYQLDGTILNP